MGTVGSRRNQYEGKSDIEKWGTEIREFEMYLKEKMQRRQSGNISRI